MDVRELAGPQASGGNRRLRVAVALVAVFFLLTAGGYLTFLVVGKGAKNDGTAGNANVRGKLTLPKNFRLKPQDLRIVYAAGKSATVDSSGNFSVDLTGSATGLLRAVDRGGNAVLAAFAPRDDLVPGYDLEVSPKTSAMAMLYMTPGLLNGDPVMSFLVLNALWQQRESKALADLLSRKMNLNPHELSNPDEQMKTAVGRALDAFLTKVSGSAPNDAGPKSTRGSGGPVSTAIPIASMAGSRLGTSFADEVSLPPDAGKDLGLELSLKKEGGNLKLSWKNSEPRWIFIYNDTQTSDGNGPATDGILPVAAALPRNCEIPGVGETAILIAKTLNPTYWLWRLVNDKNLSWFTSEWRKYGTGHFGTRSGECTFSYSADKPYLQLYTVGDMGVPHAWDSVTQIRYGIANGMTNWHLMVNPEIEVLCDIRLDEDAWNNYETLQKLPEVFQDNVNQVMEISSAVSNGNLSDAFGKARDYLVNTAIARKLLQLRNDLSGDTIDQAISAVGAKASLITTILDAISYLGTKALHLGWYAEMMLNEKNYGCYRMWGGQSETDGNASGTSEGLLVCTDSSYSQGMDHLVTVNPKSGAKQPLFNNKSTYDDPVTGLNWDISPDGMTICAPGGQSIRLYRISDSQKVGEISTDVIVDALAFSPDGSTIALSSGNLGIIGGIAVVNRDGTGFHRISDTDAGSGTPCWSPDGSKICRELGAIGYLGIGVIDVRSASEKVLGLTNVIQQGLTQENGKFSHSPGPPRWSPAGNLFLFYGTIQGNQTERSGLYTVPVVGGDARLIVEGSRFGGYDFSPDGSRIAYSDSNADLWIAGTDGSGARKVASNVTHVRWVKNLVQ